MTERMSAAERREAILDAAVEEFATHGYEGATTAGVAARAGISQPYVFRFFPTKKDLYIAVIDRCTARILHGWETAAPLPGESRLETLGRAYVETLPERRKELMVKFGAYGVRGRSRRSPRRCATTSHASTATSRTRPSATGPRPPSEAVGVRRSAGSSSTRAWLSVSTGARRRASGPRSAGARPRSPGHRGRVLRRSPDGGRLFFGCAFLMLVTDHSTTHVETRKEHMSSDAARALWTFVITSIGLFMVTLDNLVVTMALPVDPGRSRRVARELEWTVNAYTLTFAVLLLTGAALGDRFGRKRMFAIGMAIFTVASAAAALAPSSRRSIVARAFQGAGGAIVMPLTLTLLSAAVAPEKRGLALGAWGGIAGLASRSGRSWAGLSWKASLWQWIFWLNVPIGLVLLPLALRRLNESYGPHGASTCRASGSSAPAFSASSGESYAATARAGRASRSLGAIGIGAALVAAFVLWEPRDADADAADAVLPQPDVHRHERRLPVHVLRDVRLHLPARAVPPDRPGLLAARGRPSDAAVDGDADVHLADCRSCFPTGSEGGH